MDPDLLMLKETLESERVEIDIEDVEGGNQFVLW